MWKSLLTAAIACALCGCTAIARYDSWKVAEGELGGTSCHAALGGTTEGWIRPFGSGPVSTLHSGGHVFTLCSERADERLLFFGPLLPILPFFVSSGHKPDHLGLAIRAVRGEILTLDPNQVRLRGSHGEPLALAGFTRALRGCSVGPEPLPAAIALRPQEFVWLCFSWPADEPEVLDLELPIMGLRDVVHLQLRRERGTYLVVTG
jgi:hypothetical protein